MRASRALGQFPVVLEKIFEVVVAPLRRGRGPNHFQTAADRVTSFARLELALPAEALLLDAGSFGDCTYIGRIASSVSFTESMTAGNQRNRFFVVHRHAAERFANVLGRRNRIRLTVRPFRIHVDQPHLNSSERIRKVPVAAVALVRQPFALGSPEDVLFGLPDIGSTTAKTKGLEAHRLECDVARKNHQVGPGNLSAVLLLDRPQQTPRLVEVHVVRPAIERREALLTRPGAAPAVADAVRACAMPRHANK